MSIEANEIEEKSKENNLSSDFDEEDLLRYDYVPKKKVNENKLLRESKIVNQRLSCQPVLSYNKRHDSNGEIRASRTRKKTTADYYKISYKDNILSSFLGTKSGSLDPTKYKKNEEEQKYDNIEINNKRYSDFRCSQILRTKYRYKKKENKGYIKKLSGKLNIYEREKRNIQRKNNYIKKKKAQQIKEENEQLKIPTMNKRSQDIIDNNPEYIPIDIRGVALHSKNLFEIMLYENKKQLLKAKEEEKEYEIVKQYSNKKQFNKDDWEDFIRNQEMWNKEKQFKAKAAELFRNNIEQKVHYIPEIDKNSQLMIDDMRKKTIYIDDIHTRLYNDFDDLQERRKMKICNSMPSFKPLLNKDFNKNKFKVNKKYINNSKTNRTIRNNKKLELYMNDKLNRSKSIITHNPTKFTSKSFINNSRLKTTNTRFVCNSKLLKSNPYLNNKKSRYDENYFEEPIFISNNYSRYNKMNKSNILSNQLKFKKKNIDNNRNNTFYSYLNDKNCEIKGSFIINGNNNSYINSTVVNKKK